MNALYSLNENFEVVTTPLFAELKRDTGCENASIDEMCGEVRFALGEKAVILCAEDNGWSFYAYSHEHPRTISVECQESEIKALLVRAFSELA
jgi:hypothetical protein